MTNTSQFSLKFISQSENQRWDDLHKVATVKYHRAYISDEPIIAQMDCHLAADPTGHVDASFGMISAYVDLHLVYNDCRQGAIDIENHAKADRLGKDGLAIRELR